MFFGAFKGSADKFATKGFLSERNVNETIFSLGCKLSSFQLKKANNNDKVVYFETWYQYIIGYCIVNYQHVLTYSRTEVKILIYVSF